MKTVYRGRHRNGVFVGDQDLFCAWGEPVELPDDLAAQLIAEYPNDFGEPDPPKPARSKKDEEA